ncbi:MAG: DUF3365 domain-containing protein [Lutibacter sp.]|uniref:Tll0287-like domain-containing protein n=1 Tax=Lutibacter sp. TaxID=1925666 RepID=UPI0019F0AB99|nr:DUF3365 domain-containing protein [Lutibacter sp.]NOR28111.1 DUF3365 domain-containing protein [Lutibacter sp.]
MYKKLLILAVLLSIVACENNKLSKAEQEEYINKGKEITKASFNELSTNLMAQMKLGGPQQAVPFCNTQAMPITHQMSEKFNVTIKRTSDKVRNSENKATERELQIIEGYKTSLENSSKLSPIIEINSDKNKQFYAPIIMKEKCLVCHGKPGEQLNVKTDSLIKSFYPLDKAIGYENGDLRGIWSIEFKNN